MSAIVEPAAASVGARPTASAALQWLRHSPAAGTVLGVVLILVVGAIASPGFVSPQQLIGQLTVAAILAIVAAGQGFVVLAGKEGIDLSLGSVMSLAALLAGNVMRGHDAGIPLAIGVALAVGLAVGAINGLGVTLLRIPPLVMTLGSAGVIAGLLVVLTQGQTSGSAAPALVSFTTQPTAIGLPGVLVFWALLMLAVHLLLRHTRVGINLYAIGSNSTAAALSGVSVRLTRIAAYAVAGGLAALGGVILLGYSGTVFVGAGEQYVLPSVIAVVVGGTSLAGGRGNYFGTSIGAVFLTLLTGLLTTLEIGPAQRQVVFGLALISFLAVYGRERSLR
jgi:ribose transport system permease protein